MKKEHLAREDWTLLTIGVAEGEGLSPVQLQKTLFLLGRGFPRVVGNQYYKFVPYNYGPFDSNVYSDAEGLAAQGLVIIRRPSGKRWIEYSATPQGLAQAKKLESRVPPKVLEYRREVVKWARSLSFQQLVRSIYKAYPEFRVNSVFQE